MFFLYLALCLLILFLIVDPIQPQSFPPGPRRLPLLGNFLYFRRSWKQLGYHHLVWEKLSQRYGKLVGLKMGRNLIVCAFGADAIREILTREEFDGRPDGFFFRLRTFGKRLGIVFVDGPFWQKQRRFSLQHLKNFGFGKREMEERVIEETRQLVEVFRRKCDEPIWMHTAFDISVLNVLWAMLAGQRFDIGDVRLEKLLNILHEAFKLADISGGLLNQLPFLRFIFPELSGYNKLRDVIFQMWEFLEDTISEHKRSLGHSTPRDLIEAFLQNMHQSVDSTFSDDQLMSLCIDLFMAGSETTSNTLGFSVAYMILFPDVQRKVQVELDEVVGRNRWPNLQDRSNLKYTEAVLMEIQRFANVPPLGIAHRAIKDTHLFDYKIPNDTIILTSLYNLHMDKDFWKDPEQFRPERFLNDAGEITVNEKYFVPFGSGKRRCLGEALARANHFLFFTALLHNFDIKSGAGLAKVDVNGLDGITLSPKPFQAKLVSRYD